MNHYINKIVARIDRTRLTLKRSWARVQFDRFIHSGTIKNHDKIIADAELTLKDKKIYEDDDAYTASHDLLVKQGHALKKQVEQRFKDVHVGKNIERIIIQVPDPVSLTAGYSLFTNLAESLNFIGIPTHILGWHDNTREAIDKFNPTVLLSSDHTSYLERIDWEAIKKYREMQQLKIGLTASLAEYDNTSLDHRLNWAKKLGIDFYYSFRDEAYVSERKEYKPFFEDGYKILYLPFGANILHYYPEAGFDRDIDFVLIASKKREHTIFMKDIAKDHYGFIDGPGWKHAPVFNLTGIGIGTFMPVPKSV